MPEKVNPYDNVDCELLNGTLTITVNLNDQEVDHHPSKSGKSEVYATTGGAMRISNTGFRLNLTVYRK